MDPSKSLIGEQLRAAFPDSFLHPLTHDKIVANRQNASRFMDEDWLVLMPRILVDLLSHDESAEDESASMVAYELRSRLCESAELAFTQDQIQALVSWVIAAKAWDVFASCQRELSCTLHCLDKRAGNKKGPSLLQHRNE